LRDFDLPFKGLGETVRERELKERIKSLFTNSLFNTSLNGCKSLLKFRFESAAFEHGAATGPGLCIKGGCNSCYVDPSAYTVNGFSSLFPGRVDALG
jgi:hypothetical protein